MTQEIMQLRGEYMTLAAQQKKREAEVQALAASIRQEMISFASYSRRKVTEPQPRLHHLDGVAALLERMQQVVEMCEAVDERIAELVPLTKV